MQMTEVIRLLYCADDFYIDVKTRGINWWRNINLELAVTYLKIRFWSLAAGAESLSTNISQVSRSFSWSMNWESLEYKTRDTKNSTCCKTNVMTVWRNIFFST